MSTLIQLQRKILLEKFKSIMEKLSERLADYIEESNEENIHDIRTVVRRLESAQRILPKKVRKKQDIQDYVKKAKTLFKVNTQIRDLDIICKKLESHGTSTYLELVNYLKNRRKNQLNVAHHLALKLKTMPLPKLKGKEVKESKLNKRFQKIVIKLTTEIKQNIPIVINDDRKIEELHKLRKDFKKLRYSIELASDNDTSLELVKSLKKNQDLLGEIHDCDIMLDYLRDVKGPNELSEVIRDEILERQEKYQQFVRAIQDKKFDPEDLVLQF
jgi:CHAD domain-containing protein